MRRYRTILLLAVLCLFLVPVRPAQAAPARAVCTYLPQAALSELRSRSFAILYPAAPAGAAVLAGIPPEQLDAEYDRFAALFETSLNLPLTIRVYTDENTYACINAGGPRLAPGITHSRVGQREIALIASNILAYPAAWQARSLDILRYEVAVLFVEALSAGAAPPGLQAAVGHYAQDPATTLAALQLSPTDWGSPDVDWRELWDAQQEQLDLDHRILATSSVAYLVDEYGWAQFLTFLKDLATSGSYNRSLNQAYGQEAAALLAGWQAYLPRYFNHRWAANALYHLDLAPYEELLKGEKYAEAARQLQGILGFLEQSGQVGELLQARRLVERARAGHTAEDLVARAQSAFSAGDYARAAELVGEAQRQYSRIGNYSRADELLAFYGQMQKIQATHAKLDRLQVELSSRVGRLDQAARLLELDASLGRLGDPRGQLRARQLAGQVAAAQSRFQALAGALIAALALALLVVRIRMARRSPEVEAQL